MCAALLALTACGPDAPAPILTQDECRKLESDVYRLIDLHGGKEADAEATIARCATDLKPEASHICREAVALTKDSIELLKALVGDFVYADRHCDIEANARAKRQIAKLEARMVRLRVAWNKRDAATKQRVATGEGR